MEKTPSSSSTPRTKAKAKVSNFCHLGIDSLSDDLLLNILTKLPAQSFASAACVSKSWNRTCNRVLSRPKLASALSLNPSLPEALEEVLDKVLSEPIRPHFAIANVGGGFGLHSQKTLKLIRKKLGRSIPVIVSVAEGLIGRDALTNELKEVDCRYFLTDYGEEAESGIVLTVGFFPGLKVDAIPLFRQSKMSEESDIDKFVMHVKEYSASVSRCSFPQGILLFGEGRTDMKLVMEKLDHAMPKDTIIVGDARGFIQYGSGNDSRNAYARTKGFVGAVGLAFAQDRKRSSGEIKFHVALSNGVSPVGGKYKTASVRTRSVNSTWLTARREGQQEILDGHRILEDVRNELANLIDFPDLYIGVFKRRNLAIGSEKPRRRTSMAFHGVDSADEQYLYVDGAGLKTGDSFQIYHPDCHAALASCARVSDELKKIKLEANLENLNGGAVFGGLVFACCGRGEPFFGRSNVDSSPFSENFPGASLSGMFCSGELARSSFPADGQLEGESSVSCGVHVYSSVYLVMTYTPSQ